jgi:hypothetical protein
MGRNLFQEYPPVIGIRLANFIEAARSDQQLAGCSESEPCLEKELTPGTGKRYVPGL